MPYKDIEKRRAYGRAAVKRHAKRHPERVKAVFDEFYKKNRTELIARYKNRRAVLRSEGICTNCGKRKSTKGKVYCFVCRRKARESFRSFTVNHPMAKWRDHTKRRYGITPEQYNEMLESQGHKCAICGKPQSMFKKRLHIDHCHKTGRVRGLLCFMCNHVLPSIEYDNSWGVKALAYLHDNTQDSLHNNTISRPSE